jgi:hypothetical protein
MSMYVPIDEPGIGPIAAAAFPSNRKPIVVSEFRGPVNVNSYWSDGSKDEYVLVDLVTLRTYSVPTSHPYFDRQESGERCGALELTELPPNTALVQGGIARGNPATVRVMLRPDNMVGLLPAPVSLGDEEKVVLNIIASYRGGYRAEEFSRRGCGKYHPQHPAILSLRDKGLVTVNKAGAVAVTIDGRNAR